MIAAVVALDSAVWAGWSVAVGTFASRRPDAAFADDSWLTRPRAFEGDGQIYERVGIRRWKDRVPEFGSYGGGRAKRTLPGHDADALARFAAETRRAEYVHWGIAAIVPLFALWNPPALFAAMVGYALVANIPCIAIQRYNRLRIARVLRRRAGISA